LGALVGAGSSPVMLLAGGGLRVALVTTHLPLRAVPQAITRRKIVQCCLTLYTELRRRFNLAQPRLAVLSLNPHNGENGGTEEADLIKPAIARGNRLLRAADNLSPAPTAAAPICGPIAADTAFYRMRQGEFDAIVAMYHDQGLAALKTVAFHDGVNITLGLPLIRTSPDHGTAFDLAGTGSANPASMLAAIRTASQMADRN
jgi:4-hydroxythreonine-4-phosphate dehydrogenase